MLLWIQFPGVVLSAGLWSSLNDFLLVVILLETLAVFAFWLCLFEMMDILIQTNGSGPISYLSLIDRSNSRLVYIGGPLFGLIMVGVIFIYTRR